jgi:ATP phosphoribosyltransferase regulatory subunit
MGRVRFPTGAQPLLFEDAARRRRIEAACVSILEAARFSEIVLPIIDFAEPYAGLLGSDGNRHRYRFIDRDGELVAIRSDFTPMIARALAPVLTRDLLPLRAFYRGDVVRCAPSSLGAGDDLFQVGAEIVGDASWESDVFILNLAAEIARAFHIDPLVTYTDAAVFDVFDAATRASLATKRSGGTTSALAQKLIAGTATLDDVDSPRLRALASVVDEETFTIQLDDIDETTSYYTGLRFRVYDRESGVRIAQGGRYDTLYSTFGYDTPAIGFTFTIDALGLVERRGVAS